MVFSWGFLENITACGHVGLLAYFPEIVFKVKGEEEKEACSFNYQSVRKAYKNVYYK